MANDQRQKKFVDATVQGALAKRMVVHWVLFILAASGTSFILELFLNPFEPFNQKLATVWMRHGPFMLTAVFLVPVFVRDSISLSHRFVGPVIRLRSLMQGLAEGEETPPMKLRPDDFWQDICHDFNAVRKRINDLEVAAGFGGAVSTPSPERIGAPVDTAGPSESVPVHRA
ncbi:MAG: hypothetical protein KDA60_14300 [Planctomycetales bacterium]|nr:hypothetical protein [Planctomycetales bacterium]